MSMAVTTGTNRNTTDGITMFMIPAKIPSTCNADSGMNNLASTSIILLDASTSSIVVNLFISYIS